MNKMKSKTEYEEVDESRVPDGTMENNNNNNNNKIYIELFDLLGRVAIFAVIFHYLMFIESSEVDIIVISVIIMLWVLNPIFNRLGKI